MLFFVFGGVGVFADSKYVQDDANILSKRTISNINSLNEEMKYMDHHPVYFVYTLNGLNGESIDKVARKKFNNLGLGYSSYNYGILLAISPNDCKYYFAMGADYSGPIKSSFATKIVQDDQSVMSKLKMGRYDDAVNDITDNISKYSLNFSPKFNLLDWLAYIFLNKKIIYLIILGFLIFIGVVIITDFRKKKNRGREASIY